jgi:RNA polymerase sigma-70 factor (ECF subfamily)
LSTISSVELSPWTLAICDRIEGHVMADSVATEAVSRRGVEASGLSLDAALRRCRDGDRAAFAEVYDQLIDVVSRASGLRASEVAARNQLVVEVFLTMWRRAPRYDPSRCSPRAWALALALGHGHGRDGADDDRR